MRCVAVATVEYAFVVATIYATVDAGLLGSASFRVFKVPEALALDTATSFFEFAELEKSAI